MRNTETIHILGQEVSVCLHNGKAHFHHDQLLDLMNVDDTLNHRPVPNEFVYENDDAKYVTAQGYAYMTFYTRDDERVSEVTSHVLSFSNSLAFSSNLTTEEILEDLRAQQRQQKEIMEHFNQLMASVNLPETTRPSSSGSPVKPPIAATLPGAEPFETAEQRQARLTALQKEEEATPLAPQAGLPVILPEPTPTTAPVPSAVPSVKRNAPSTVLTEKETKQVRALINKRAVNLSHRWNETIPTAWRRMYNDFGISIGRNTLLDDATEYKRTVKRSNMIDYVMNQDLLVDFYHFVENTYFPDK